MVKPESKKFPEERLGTRSYREYMSYMVRGNYISGNVERAYIRASARMHQKAFRLVDAGVHWKDVQGRVLRALARALWQDFGETLDSKFYGGA